MGAPPPPPLLTLRDLLELACESSCSDGFRSYPRRIPWHCDDAVQAKAEEAAPVRVLVEAPSRTLSSFLFPRSPGSLTAVSRLTRSLSRRLVFWRRHQGDDDEDGDASDVGERDSLGLPSPVVSSCSASECSEHAESVAQAANLVVEAEESEKPSTSTSSGCTGSVDDGMHKATDGDPVGSMMVKQQLSPVSVMEFPFHEEEEDERSDACTCSPSSFQQCQPDDLERKQKPLRFDGTAGSSSAHEMLHKIRRLDGLAQGDLDDYSGESDDTQNQSNSSISTDQDSAATASSDEQQQQSTDDAEHQPDDHHHHRLLGRLLNDDKAAFSVDTGRLLLDFFAEGLGRLSSLKPGTVKPSDDRDDSALLRAAKEWVRGAGTQWGVEDVLFAGAAALADMDRERRWMCVGVEEREVGVAVEELVLDGLVAELVVDLVVLRC